MNLSELRGQVYSMLNESVNDFFSDDEINLWLNEAYHEIGEEALRFKETVELETISGEAFYELPSDFIEEIRVMYDGIRLNYISFNERDDNYPGYLIWEDYIELSPKPYDSGTLKMYYYKTPAELTLDTDTPNDKQVETAMFYYATGKAKLKDRQIGESQHYLSLYQQKLNQIKKKHSSAPRRRTWKVKR